MFPTGAQATTQALTKSKLTDRLYPTRPGIVQLEDSQQLQVTKVVAKTDLWEFKITSSSG